MQRFRNIITQDIPEDITTKKEGGSYPEWQKHFYYSRTAERDTPVNVLLPRGYSEDKKYPVLYILHGYFDNEDWMTRDCVKIDTMLPNLVEKGEAEEMIVVVPYIYCDKNVPACTGMNLQNSLAYDNFINDFLLDTIPFIESHFSVAKGRENTALTGFSMGGRESLFIGFKHPELFGYLGACDPAPGLIPVPESAAHPGQISADEVSFGEYVPSVVFVSAGGDFSETDLTPFNYRALMTHNGVEHLWQHVVGVRHDHTIVEPHLYNFFRMAFRVK